ncbi:MAG: nucleotidyltransferase domain-containing protein [Candidatus Kariarchaeaceae archaeon]|jgi:predicted nucleotidyltransferase
MREKIIKIKDPQNVIYSKEHKRLLQSMRKKASNLMKAINQPSILYGSCARGDVNEKSDIDIVFLNPLETFILEMPLIEFDYSIQNRELVQANPNSVPKAQLELEDNITLTVPLFRPTLSEEEFYRFGGSVNLEELDSGLRVPGVSKKLLVVEPTTDGHLEYSLLGREVEVARKLKLQSETVSERVRVLSRRDKIGRTGVYLKIGIEPDSTFESTWKYLSDRDPVLRRHWKIRKK